MCNVIALKSCNIPCFYMRLLYTYNISKCFKIMRQDRMKNQMIGQLNECQCDQTSGTCPVIHVHFIVGMLVRVRVGIYSARFRCSSVQQTKLIAREDNAQDDDKNKSQMQGQVLLEANMLLQYILYQETTHSCSIFAHSALFVSQQIKTWRIPMSLFTTNGTNSRGKTVNKSKNITERK